MGGKGCGGFERGKLEGEGPFGRLYSLVVGIQVFGELLLLLEGLSRLVLVYRGNWVRELSLLAVLELMVAVDEGLQLLLI